MITCTNCGKVNPTDGRFCSDCGVPITRLYTSTPSSHLTSGTCLRDRYIIKRELGQGGFGKTYLAEDKGRFNELVTLKELTPVNQGTLALQKAEELFQREAVMLHQLSSPQIPRFWEFFREGRRLFLVQDYIEGKTYQSLLEERIAIGQTFSEAEIIQILRQLLPVLSYIHTVGVIHRDISPDNIICRTRDKTPVLIDLGGVKQIIQPTTVGSQNPPASSSLTRLGKVGYAPEEQLRLGIAASHSDLYALGVTALVLMTGKQPQDLIDPNTLNWLWQDKLSLSQQMSHLLSRMVAPQPAERFHSAEEILQQLPAANTDVSTTQMSHTIPVTPPQGTFQPALVNNSGCGKLFDESVKVPAEIAGWNWGAFWLPGFWCLSNQVWLGLIAWVDISFITLPLTLGLTWPIVGIVLGIKGNEWAWKSRRWQSIKDFKRHQRGWAFVSWLIISSLVGLLLLILVLILIFGIAIAGIG
ncbi:MAG: protein kinase [Symploca sp. SIO2E6]|nr:protein kinase [Symploca sp. SIO2E6]